MTSEDYYNRRLALEQKFDYYLLTGDIYNARKVKKQIGELIIQGVQELTEQDFLENESAFTTDDYYYDFNYDFN